MAASLVRFIGFRVYEFKVLGGFYGGLGFMGLWV